MLRCTLAFVASLTLLSCGKDRKETAEKPTPTAQGSGSASDTPAGSADTGPAAKGAAESGSADAGSAAAGSGDGGDSAGSGDGSDAVAVSDFDFDKLTHDDKVKFMKQKVMPTMKPLLQKFDSKEFAKVTCKTCHGKEPAKVKYEMPSPDLPKLDFKAIDAGKEDPKMVEFMTKVVTPKMAELLNEPEMSETQPDGFGCLDCHMEKKK